MSKSKNKVKLMAIISAMALLLTFVSSQWAPNILKANAESNRVDFAKCDGTEGAIFHPGGLSGNERTLSKNNNVWENHYRVIPSQGNAGAGAVYDFSGSNVLKFDMYVSNVEAYDLWKNNMQFVILDSSKNSYVFSEKAEFTSADYIEITLDLTKVTNVDLSKVEEFAVDIFPTGDSSVNFDGSYMEAAEDVIVCLKDIYADYIQKEPEIPDVPVVKPDITNTPEIVFYNDMLVTTMSEDNDKDGPNGRFHYLQDRLYKDNITAANFSNVAKIEFDFYVSDWEALKAKIDVNSNILKKLMLGVGSQADNRFLYRYSADFMPQVTKSGWNHIVLFVDDFTQMGTGDIDWKKVSTWSVFFADTAPGSTEVVLGDVWKTKLGIANIVGTEPIKETSLPKNVVALLDKDGLEKTLADDAGGQFHFLGDRLNKENLTAVDFSKADYIELDLYVSNFDKLEQQLETVGIDTLNFNMSSGSNRFEGRYGYNILPLITKSGWNHIKVKKSDFATTNGEINWTTVKNWMFYFGTDPGKSLGNAWNVTLKAVNICGTAVPVEIPENPDQPSRPDTNANYISEAETLVDENGSWNPNSAFIDTKYKTEGKGSISNTFKDQTLKSNSLRYLLNNSLNLTKSTKIKFDLFIQNPTLLNEKSKTSFVISSDSRAADNYYSWPIDVSALQKGWNQIEIDLASGFTKTGTLDISAIKNIIFQCDQASFTGEDEVSVKIDNLRYLGTVVKNPDDIDDSDDSSDNSDSDITTPETGDFGVKTALMVLSACGALVGLVLVVKGKKRSIAE